MSHPSASEPLPKNEQRQSNQRAVWGSYKTNDIRKAYTFAKVMEDLDALGGITSFYHRYKTHEYESPEIFLLNHGAPMSNDNYVVDWAYVYEGKCSAEDFFSWVRTLEVIL